MDKKAQLIAVAEDTLSLLKIGHYNKNDKIVYFKNEMEQAIKGTTIYSPLKLDSLKIEPVFDYSTIIETTNETTLAAAKRLKEEGYDKVLSLNFASARTPGGGFLKGAIAQEESLARASGLYPTISKMNEMYNHNRRLSTALYSDYMIYSPNVPVIKDDNGVLLEQFYTTSFITSAAPNAKVIREKEPQNIKKIDQVIEKRIEKILTIALEHKEEALVLGAFGCGVFKNNPYSVAHIFKKLLYDCRFKKQFKKVVFAIYDTTSKKEIFNVFKSIIGKHQNMR